VWKTWHYVKTPGPVYYITAVIIELHVALKYNDVVKMAKLC